MLPLQAASATTAAPLSMSLKDLFMCITPKEQLIMPPKLC
jgi:hypothetical protein